MSEHDLRRRLDDALRQRDEALDVLREMCANGEDEHGVAAAHLDTVSQRFTRRKPDPRWGTP